MNHQVNVSNGIDSLTNFKRHTPDIVRKIKKTGKPLVLTVNGKAEVVVQDAASYQKLLDRLEKLETIEAILEGLKDMREGKGRPAREVLEELRKKHQIPSDA